MEAERKLQNLRKQSITREELAIPSRIKVFNSIQNDTYYNAIKCIFIARKIHHGKFSANIWSQCTCQFDVIMKIVDALQLQREADPAVFDDKNCIL